MSVKVVHPVTNLNKVGPGHSCFDVEGTTYTFEGQGWRILPFTAYVSENERSNRPLVVQELVPSVDGQKAVEYVMRTIRESAGGNSYGYAGICSSQVARALHFAIPGGFPGGGPGGLEDFANIFKNFKPSDLYKKLKDASLSVGYSVIWKEPEDDFNKDHFRSCIRTFIGEEWRPQILTREDMNRYQPSDTRSSKM